MSKRQEAKRAELAAAAEAKGYMTVADLGAYLKTFPQDAPVTGYNGQECTDFVTPSGVNFREVREHDCLYLVGAQKYVGPSVDIMGR